MWSWWNERRRQHSVRGCGAMTRPIQRYDARLARRMEDYLASAMAPAPEPVEDPAPTTKEKGMSPYEARLIAAERRNRLMETIGSKWVWTGDLCEMFGIERSPAIRDLRVLEETGRLKMVYRRKSQKGTRHYFAAVGEAAE